jgi:hypothetical protein
MSVSSDATFHFERKTFIKTDYLEYQSNNLSLWSPLNFGISAGVKLSSKRELLFGLNTDGCSVVYKVYSESYQNGIGYMPGRTSIKSKAFFFRYYINYKYSIVETPNKTNLSFIIGLGIMQRGGPKYGGESTGSGSVSNTIDEYGTTYVFTNNSITWHKRGYLINFGMGSDIYFNGKYLLSTSLIFTYAPYTMGRDKNTLTINNATTGYNKTWIHWVDMKGSGLYLGISRKFLLHKNKQKKIEDKKDYFK